MAHTHSSVETTGLTRIPSPLGKDNDDGRLEPMLYLGVTAPGRNFTGLPLG
jgi:hypothetical protein